MSYTLTASGGGLTNPANVQNGNAAIMFDGTHYLGGVDMMHGAPINGTGSRTLAIAVKLAVSNVQQGLVGQAVGSGANGINFDLLAWHPAAWYWYGFLFGVDLYAGAAPNTSWHIVAMTYNLTGTAINIYLDGTSIASSSNTLNTSSSSFVVGNRVDSTTYPLSNGSYVGDVVLMSGIPADLTTATTGFLATMAAKWGSGSNLFNPNDHGTVVNWFDPNQNCCPAGTMKWTNAIGLPGKSRRGMSTGGSISPFGSFSGGKL